MPNGPASSLSQNLGQGSSYTPPLNPGYALKAHSIVRALRIPPQTSATVEAQVATLMENGCEFSVSVRHDSSSRTSRSVESGGSIRELKIHKGGPSLNVQVCATNELEFRNKAIKTIDLCAKKVPGLVQGEPGVGAHDLQKYNVDFSQVYVHGVPSILANPKVHVAPFLENSKLSLHGVIGFGVKESNQNVYVGMNTAPITQIILGKGQFPDKGHSKEHLTVKLYSDTSLVAAYRIPSP